MTGNGTMRRLETEETDNELSQLINDADPEVEQDARVEINLDAQYDVSEHIGAAMKMIQNEEDQEFGRASKTIEDEVKERFANMDAELRHDFKDEMDRERAIIENSQYQGLKRILHTIGLYAAPAITDKQVLDSVIGGEMEKMDFTVGELQVINKQTKRTLDDRKGVYKNIKTNLAKFVDHYEEGSKKLEGLQELLTTNIKARDHYLSEKASPGYNGRFDENLRTATEAIDSMTEQMEDLEEAQDRLGSRIKGYVQKINAVKQKIVQAKVEYQTAEEALQATKLARDEVREMRADKDGRKSRLAIYQILGHAKGTLERADRIRTAGASALDKLPEMYGKVFGDAFDIQTSADMESYQKGEAERAKKQSDAIETAKAIRYGLA